MYVFNAGYLKCFKMREVNLYEHVINISKTDNVLFQIYNAGLVNNTTCICVSWLIQIL